MYRFLPKRPHSSRPVASVRLPAKSGLGPIVPGQERKIAKLEEMIGKNGIEFIRLEQTDMHGIARSKTILSKYFRERVQKGQIFTPHLSTDPASNDVRGTGYLEEMNYGDFITFPDLDTFQVLPWSENTARVIVEPVQENGLPVPAHPRWVAKQQVQRLEEIGYKLFSSFEHEFYVVDDQNKPLDNNRNVRATLKNNKVPKLFHQILLQMPGEISHFESEGGPGQFEIPFKPTWGIRAADEAFTFKTGVKEIAQQQGYTISFMTKPYPGQSGSSAHYNYSIWDITGEKGLFFHPNQPNKLSQLGEYWLAGNLAHAKSVACLMAPTVNCWRNLTVKRAYVPYNVSWGLDNRTTLIRVKTRGEKDTYFENRLVCGSANPYLCLAATVAAGMDGIKRRLPLAPDISGEAFDLPADVSPPLPRNLGEALDALNQDQVMVDALGHDFVKCFTTLKRHEIELCKQKATTDPDWERKYYFQFL